MKRLEICTNPEWLQVFSGIDFNDIEMPDAAADDFTNGLYDALSQAGFSAIWAQGQRRTTHGWNGANTFRHKLGPVGTFEKLTSVEVDAIYNICDHAEELMRQEWAD